MNDTENHSISPGLADPSYLSKDIGHHIPTRSNFYTVEPAEGLADVVKHFWVFRHDGEELHTDYLLPSGLGHFFLMRTSEDFYTNHQDNCTRSLIQNGYYTGYLNTLTEYSHRKILVVGAAIYPIYMNIIFKKAIDQIMNRFCSFESGCLPDVSSLQNASEQEIITVIEQYITDHLDHDPLFERVHGFYRHLVKTRNYKMNVAEMAHEFKCSTRHLNSVFQDHLGLSPKRVLQLIRFNHAVHLMEISGCNTNLRCIAHQLGYHDQAHFVKDFKKTCGKTPRELQMDCDSVSRKFLLYE